PPRAHGRGRDARPRDRAAPPAAPERPAARGSAPPRRRPDGRARPRPRVRPDRRGPAARPRPPRPAADRGACARTERGAARRAPALRRGAPRRPCRTNGRSGGPVPREPARRGRRDPQDRLTPLLLALGASLAWGVGDFIGPVAARTTGSMPILVWSQAGGVAAIALAVAIR